MSDVIKNTVHQDLRSCLSLYKQHDKDLYQHVSDVMSHIVQHCPQEALPKFEEISYLLKHKNEIDVNQFLKISVSKNYARPADEFTKEATQVAIEKSKVFFATSKKTVNEDGEEVEEAATSGPVGNIPDI
mmetsp:Transcript_17763/g.30077  ORF Transcript_17763/g.30077 Transcript_17763/m.30077 type:complete len:130 (-) Transcript_17763:1114-1503(-)